MVVTKGLSVLVSYAVTLTIFAHKFISLFTEIKKIHLSEFLFIRRCSSYFKAMTEYSSNLPRTNSELFSQTEGVVSLARLHTSQR